MSGTLLALIANIALTLSVIVAVIFGIAQVRLANKDRRERLTLETLRQFQTREFAEILHFIHNMKFPANYDEWRLWGEQEQIRFIQLSQEMESLGLLLAERLINFDLLDKTLGSFVFTTWAKYKPVVVDMRTEFDDPLMSEYFQWMAEQIEKRMEKRPRKPFFLSAKKVC